MNNTVKITYTFPDGAGGTFTDTDQIQIEHLQAEVQQIIDKAVRNQTNSIIKLLKDKLSPIIYEQHECVSIEDVLVAIKGENK